MKLSIEAFAEFIREEVVDEYCVEAEESSRG